MSSQVESKGRLRYVEPLNDDSSRPLDGNWENSIMYPYEDYCMAVDLTVIVTNRYSCGLSKSTGESEEFTYSSANGTLSFLGGTNGVLTTNFTDISMTNPAGNTVECLGIESINIAYNSWMYPQVDIKFVDVRGATIMMPAEENYYNETSRGTSYRLYKSFFSFPYPEFKLKVKGFYGRGVTYNLVLNKTDMEIDSANGNFNINAHFIGKQFGIYADMPMNFIAIAPYTTEGSKYWSNKVQDQTFYFMDVDGNPSLPMYKIPELRKRLAEVANSEECTSVATEGEQIQMNLDARIETINAINGDYPYREYKEGGNHIFNVVKEAPSFEELQKAQNDYKGIVEEYNKAYETNHTVPLAKLESKKDLVVIQLDKKECIGKHSKLYDEYINSLSDDERNTIISFINQFADADGTSYIVVLEKDSDFKLNEATKRVTDDEENVRKEKEAREIEYKAKEEAAIEKVLGFRPSIRNIYNLVFAHMDTFMHNFYQDMAQIKSELESDADSRKKSFYNIKDGDTDTERVGGAANSYDRAFKLPPFTAFYKQGDKNGTSKVLRWPGEIANADRGLVEINFVKDMISATQQYMNVSESIEDEISAMTGGTAGGGRTDGAAPTDSIDGFIPLTTYDYVNKDRMPNPYSEIRDRVTDGNESIEGTILGLFALRAFYYICSNEQTSNDARSFGIVEAINFFKGVGEKTSETFLSFIKKYADGSDKNGKTASFITEITTESKDNVTKVWNLDKSLVTEKSLFKARGGLTYNLHKYNLIKYLPLQVSSFEELIADYSGGEAPLSTNRRYLAMNNEEKAYSATNVSTCFIYEDRDFLTNIYNKIKDEIKNSDDKLKANDPDGYGKRRSDEYGNVKSENKTIKNITNNIENDFDDKVYKNNSLCDSNGDKVKGLKDIIGKGTRDDRNKVFIKYPSYVDEDKNEPIFEHDLYKQQEDIVSKAYLFLQSLPIKGRGKNGGIDEEATNGVTLKARLLREGSYYWRKMLMENGDKKDPIITEGFKKPGANETFMSYRNSVDNFETIKPIKENGSGYYIGWQEPKGCTSSRKKKLIDLFTSWAKDYTLGFAGMERYLTNIKLYGGKYNESTDTVTEREFKNGLDIKHLAGDNKKNGETATMSRKLQEMLRDLFLSVYTVVDYYGGVNNFACSIDLMNSAFKGFIDELHAIYGDEVKEATKNPDEFKKRIAEARVADPFNNKDIRLSTYMTLKSLYDKWLCAPFHGPATWQLNNPYSDFDEFVYVDTFYHNIGYHIMANVSKVSNWLSSCLPTENLETNEGTLGYTGKSVLDFLSEVAQDCGGTLYCLPQKFAINSDYELRDMFTPHSINTNWDDDSTSFVFMYSYKPSEHLGDDNGAKYDMNGWSRDGDGINLTDDEVYGVYNDEGFSIPAFGVSYGRQNQCFFKNITLNNTDFSTTEVAIAATANIASKASTSPRESTLYGQDLYRVFSQYAYQCTVEGMGNMQITPLMYFQLNNVPMWKGAYIIKKVTHSITAGNISTTFEGVRLNKYAIPISDATLMAMKDTGENPTPPKETTNTLGGGVTTVAAGEANGVKFGEANSIKGNPNHKLSPGDVEDFEPTNVTREKPIICLTPGHGPNTGKKLEYGAMKKIITDYLAPSLRECRYKDGTPYNVQVCNKNGAHTGANGYSMAEAQNLIKKYGSDKVISIALHWNGMAGARHCTFVGYNPESPYLTSDYLPTREDSIEFGRYMMSAAKEVAQMGLNGEFKLAPTGFFGTGKTSIEQFEPKHKTGKINQRTGEEEYDGNTDGGPRINCPCILTENWFGDYPNATLWNNASEEKKLSKDESGKYLFGSGWLYDDEGAKAITLLHVKGIKSYIENRTIFI